VSLSCQNELLNSFRNSDDSEVRSIALKTTQGGKHSICKHEWDTHKTCCDAKKLEKYAKDKILEWKNHMTSFANNLKKVEKPIVKKIADIETRIRTIGDYVKKYKHKCHASNESIQAAIKYSDVIDQLLIFFEEKNYRAKKKRFLKEADSCFTKVKDFRLNTLCLKCSGRAQSFVEDNRLRISQDTCLDMVQACAGSWNFMYEFMQGVKAITTVTNVRRSMYRSSSRSKWKRKAGKGPDTSMKSNVIVEQLRKVAAVK
jgi:hypothetical protein